MLYARARDPVDRWRARLIQFEIGYGWPMKRGGDVAMSWGMRCGWRRPCGEGGGGEGCGDGREESGVDRCWLKRTYHVECSFWALSSGVLILSDHIAL